MKIGGRRLTGKEGMLLEEGKGRASVNGEGVDVR